jgi:F0F1-type ATP synthase beta subunit
MTKLLSHVAHRPVMLFGEAGCGKTALVREYVQNVVCEMGRAGAESVLTLHTDRHVNVP